MSATGQANIPPTVRVQYTSASAADTQWASPGKAADWLQIIGAGSTVVTDEAGNAASPQTTRTFTTDAAEPVLLLMGPFFGFTSTTATRVRMGQGEPPQALNPTTAASAATSAALGLVQLSGGLTGSATNPQLAIGNSANLSGVMPAANVQDYADSTTIYTTSFTATVAQINPFNFQLAGSITFPAVTAANDGQSLVLFNNGTGATANALFGSAAGNVVLSGTGPTSLKSTRYTASVNLGGWIPGI